MSYTVQYSEVTYIRGVGDAHTTYLTLHTVVFVDKLPHYIIRCKTYRIPNAQNKICEMLNGS